MKMVIFNGLQLLIVGILLNCKFLLISSKGLTARISPKKTGVLRGEYGVFNCQITGDPLPTITWYNNGKNIMKDSRSKIQKVSGGYMIRYGKLYRAFHHHGNISCKASNGVDPPAIDTAILNVFKPTNVSLAAGFPKLVARYKPYVKIVVGKNVTLVVNVTGNPEPKITWFKDLYLMDLRNPRITLLPNNSLHLTNVQLADKGVYDYVAENDKGQKLSRPWIVIPYFNNTAPVFVKGGPEDRVVDPQTTVLINCSATGYPKPDIDWKDSHGDRIVHNDGLLKINNILNSETYKCIAKNVVSEIFKFVKVTVRGIPLAPVNVLEKSKTGSALTISWLEGSSSIAVASHVVKHRKKGDQFWHSTYKADSQTVWTIKYLKAYTDYEVQVFSKNTLGISKGSIVETFKTDETAPGTAPRNIVVKAIGKWSFEVSWDPPQQPNGQVISYTVYYTDEPEKNYQDWNPETSVRSPCKVYGLKADHRYAVVISARTAAGSGPLSKHFLVQTVKGAPSEPQNVKTKVLSSSAVQISWSKPIFNGGGQGIVGYEVYYNVSSSLLNTKVNVQSPDENSKKVTGLIPYTTYKFAVAAKTDAGTGPISISIFAQTVEDVPSAAPANLTCVAPDASTLRCSWRSPPFHSRNGRIIGYTIRYKAVNQQYSRQHVPASAMSLVLRKLQPYTLYAVDITAKTLLGEGPFSHPITVITKETKPLKAPKNLVAEVLNSTAIHVRWQAPSPPFGAKLLGYIVYYRRYPKEDNMKTRNTWGNKVDTILTNLVPETEYELSVAINSVKGSGKVTDVLRVITKQSAPPAPILRFRKRSSPHLGVDVSWTSAARDIQEFRLRYAKEVEQINDATLLRKLTYVEKNFSRSVTSYNYTKFGPGLWYFINLSVRNPGGWSVERKVWVQMDAAKPSGAPLNLTVEATSSTSLQLSWDLPSKWKRNGEIIGYRLSYKRAQTTEKKQVKDLDKKTNIKLQDLNKFTRYKFWIRAKTVAGLGPGAEIQGTTKQDVPSTAPQITQARGMGMEVVLLKLVPPSRPNGVITGYKVDIYLGNPKTVSGKIKTDEFLGRNIEKIYISELFREKIHWFKVTAKTKVGYGPYSAAVFTKTLDYDLPLPVRQLSVSFGKSGPVKLTWKEPISTVAVQKYQISYLGKKSYRGANNKIETTNDNNIIIVTCCEERFANLNNLVPYTSYVANVTSMSISEKSESQWINFTTKATSSPPFPKPNITETTFSENYIPIHLSRASERNGPISHYLVYVASLGTSLVGARKKLQEISKSSSKKRSRREVRKDNKDIYVTAKLLGGSNDVIFHVGEGQDVNGYTNKRLTKKHFYAFSVESCVFDEDLTCLVTTSGFTDIIWFAENPIQTAAAGGGSGKSDSKLWLLGPVGAVVFLVIVILVICLLWRRRVRSKRDKPKHLNKWLQDEQSPMITSPKDPVEMQRLNLETEGMKEHPRIPISELGLHIEDLEANSNNLFTREYESIEPGITITSEVSARHLNQSKNRYPNIVPYDHTRVVLQETSGFLDSDYINANFMAGYRKPNGYIATQAPLPNTITDFWQMVWEQDTRTIVMMSSLQEKGRIKCDQYWPNRVSEKFGYVSVTVVETVELAHYTIRTFRLCKDGLSDMSKEVKQFQYTAWPDHGVPHYSTSLLCFIRKVRLSNSPDAGPIVVHCSAGVGRTGVFIVVDSMLERIRREQTVDVYGHVTLLRSQRNHMVQTEDQYIFIHETLLEAVLFGSTEIQASDLSQYYKKLNEIGETETTNIEEQFKLLSSFNHPHRFVTAVLPVNKTKNRYPRIVPYEQSRVDLVPTRGVDGSNYINASFIDGYKQRKAYVAAQSPLDETVNDFWRMIMEKKTNIIVMLSETNEDGQEMSAEYWPREKSVKYHYYIVDPVSEEETPNFTLRQFKVNDMMGACPTLIKLFQLKKWPERGKPQSCKGILDLIGQVHTAKNNDETKGPVVVHCSSGSGRTGVFCALSIVVERMRAEGLVDLLQTVRHLREQRPQMVETLEEYSFCYETALYYLTSFDHIA